MSSRLCTSACAVCAMLRSGEATSDLSAFTTPKAASARSGLARRPRKKLMTKDTPFSVTWVTMSGQENLHM